MAIVDERPYIELFLLEHPKFAVVGSEFTKSGWGFVSFFPLGQKEWQLNQALGVLLQLN
jgi:hypothetical protein